MYHVTFDDSIVDFFFTKKNLDFFSYNLLESHANINFNKNKVFPCIAQKKIVCCKM